MAPSGPAELAVVSVAAVCRPAGDGGRAMRFDRAVRQRGRPPPLERGAAAVTGASVRAGTAGAGECGAAAWLRCGTRSGLLGPACWGVTVGFPAADGATAGCRGPATREYSPKPSATTSASASATVQPSRRPGERAAGTDWLTHCGRADLVPQRRTGGGYQPRHRRQGRPTSARSLGRRGQQLLQAYRRQHLRRPADRVVLLDQRPRVGPDGLGDAADVPPRVEVAAAPGVVVALDPPDDRFPDPGPLTDLGNGETGSLARFRQGCTNRHAAPPQLCRPAYRPRGQEAGRSRPHHFTRSPRRIGCLVLFAASRPASGPLDAHRRPGPGAECLRRRAWAGRCDAGDQLHDLRGRTGGLPVRITLVVAGPQLGRAHAEIAKPVLGWIFLESGTPDQGYLHPAVNAVHPVDVRSYSAIGIGRPGGSNSRGGDRPRVGMPFRCAACARPGTPFPGGKCRLAARAAAGMLVPGACGAGRRSAREGGRGARADPGR